MLSVRVLSVCLVCVCVCVCVMTGHCVYVGCLVGLLGWDGGWWGGVLVNKSCLPLQRRDLGMSYPCIVGCFC